MTRTLTAIALATALLSTGAMAQTPWQKDHPGRTELNQRLANQNARIHQEVLEGDLLKGQPAALHQEDRQIRTEERFMAHQNHNGGHLTKQEWQTLNQQENGISGQIGK
jgi:hypothetical protein